MQLFNETPKSTEKRKIGESYFEFLNRLGGELGEKTRAAIENWLSHLPEKEQDRFAEGLQKGNDGKCDATLF